MEKEEFEIEFTKYVKNHPRMSKDDSDTYDLLVNEYMTKCHNLNDSDKEIFKYPNLKESY